MSKVDIKLTVRGGGYYKNNTLKGIKYNTNKTTTKGGVVLWKKNKNIL